MPEPDAVIDGRYHGWLDVTVASWLVERGAGLEAHAILLGRSWAPKRRPSEALATLLQTEGSAGARELREEIAAAASSLDGSDASLVLDLVRRLEDGRATDARTPRGEDPVRGRNTGAEGVPGELCEADRALADARRLTQDFAAMVRGLEGEKLGGWLAEAEASEARMMQKFAAGLKRDLCAVRAGLTEEWSNGPASEYSSNEKTR